MQKVSSFSEIENFFKDLLTYCTIFVELSGLNEKFSLQTQASIDMYIIYALHVTSMHLRKKALHIHIVSQKHTHFLYFKGKTYILNSQRVQAKCIFSGMFLDLLLDLARQNSLLLALTLSSIWDL